MLVISNNKKDNLRKTIIFYHYKIILTNKGYFGHKRVFWS